MFERILILMNPQIILGLPEENIRNISHHLRNSSSKAATVRSAEENNSNSAGINPSQG